MRTDVLAGRFLETYATESLKVMARRRGLAEATIASKARLIEFLGPRLFSREANRRLVQSLPERQRRLLAALRARGGEADTVALAAAVEGEADEAAADIRTLAELGLLLYPRAGRNRKYRIGQCERVWMDRTTADAVEPLAAAGPTPKLLADPPEMVREAAPALLLADLFVVLQHLERHFFRPPAAGDGGEGEGWARLGRSLLLPEPTGAAGGRLRFLYLLLEETGLLKVKGGRLVPAETAGTFFHQDAAARLRRLYAAWKGTTTWDEFRRIPELVRRPVPDESGGDHLPSAGRVARARSRVLAALKRFDPGRWYAFSSLRREIKSSYPDFLVRRDAGGAAEHTYRGIGERGRGAAAHPLDLTADWDRVEGRFIGRVLLEPLSWLGVVDLGFETACEPHHTRLDAFRITAAGAHLLGLSAALPQPESAGPALVVQPDFSLLVLASSPDPVLLFDVSRFAAFDGGDRVIRFALTRDSVRRGFHAGWDRARILALLESASPGPVPQNVAASLAEWERAFRSFRIVRGVRLLEDADQVLPAPGAAGALHATLGEPLARGVWRVPSRALEPLREILRRTHVDMQRFDYSGPPAHVLDLGPDLDITCHGRGSDWLTLSMLERIARPEGKAGAGTWKLEKNLVRRAVAGGLDAGRILRFLEARSRRSSPEIRLALAAWTGNRQPATVARHTLFVCEEARLLERMLDVPALGRCLGERLAADIFVVRRGQVGAFRAALRRLGVRLSDRGPLRVQPPDAGATDLRPSPDASPLPFRWARHGAAGNAAGQADEQLHFLLTRAAAARRRIRMGYALRASGRTVRRELSPLAVSGGFLSAYCPASRRERSYPLDRIVSVELLPNRD